MLDKAIVRVGRCGEQRGNRPWIADLTERGGRLPARRRFVFLNHLHQPGDRFPIFGGTHHARRRNPDHEMRIAQRRPDGLGGVSFGDAAQCENR